ncbi:YkgJ family cysteine cluster protein [Nibricoccus aquaticus]|uniref:YkgJ family cysteine cluster protein n=1 Tax=Nibricoccus aquaticus TaxID=2576891 RepID=UPI001FEBB78A|nr:YkgJ family cysteine cluster protein [Nibricoccus aquaticus]
MNTPDDCRRCGVCCFSSLESYVRVSGDDWTRLGDAAERVAHFVGNRAFMLMREGHCAALELRHAEDGAAEFFCSIYEQRPQICRDLARGSPECGGEREMKGAGLFRLHDVR